MTECKICGIWGHTQKHHLIFGTGYRKLSDKYGLIINVCFKCHRKIHDNGEMALWSKQEGQRIFEKEHGHTKYMEVFGRNFL